MQRAARAIAVLLACLAAASPAAAARKPLDSPAGPFHAPRAELALAGVGAAADVRAQGRSSVGRADSWWGGPVVTSTGESVTVYVSSAFAQDESIRTGWAEFFAWLYHGRELADLKAYAAPLAEVGEICGNPQADGCYRQGGVLVFPGDAGEGMDKEIAAHEYGHHVAANRSNDPWPAFDWGPKRWATSVGVCGRAAAGTVFPGDEGDHYELNSGEAFAEAYRVLNEQREGGAWGGLPLVVDPTLAPDARSLAAALADVQQPWSAQTRRWEGTSGPPPPPPVALRASVGPGEALALRLQDGTPVARLAAGRYAIRVRDGSGEDNFHLAGPRGVDRKTSLHGKGTVVWNVTLAPGRYRYWSDARPRARRSFGVAAVATAAPQPQEQAFTTDLDGTFTAFASGAAAPTLELVDAATGEELDAPGGSQVSYVVCGRRAVVLRVLPTRPGAFQVFVIVP